jgi:hypothetical protein
VKLPPSSLHSNVEPVSDEEKPKLGEASFEGFAGLESMVDWGAAVSTVRSIVTCSVDEEADTLPATSVASAEIL